MNMPTLKFDTPINIPLADIEIGERLRRVDAAHVEGLKHSIEGHGLFNPIQVTSTDRKRGPAYRLISGAHRLEAVRVLGREQIAAIVVTGDALQLRLAAIDENLIRHELRPWDRAVFLAERKAVYDALHPEAGRGAKGRQVIEKGHTAKLAVWADAFSKVTADRLGLGERSVQRAVSMVSKINPDLHTIIAALPMADNQSELEALAKQPVERQARVVELLTSDAEPAANVRAAVAIIEKRRVSPKAAADKAYEKLIDLWDRAPMPARRQFLTDLRNNPKLARLLRETGLLAND